MLDAAVVDLLSGGCGRGSTVLCTLNDADLIHALASIAGATGLLIIAGMEPAAGDGWHAVRCAPEQAIPVRSHVIDAAVVVETDNLPGIAHEVRRVLAPGGDVRVLLTAVTDVTAALGEASIEVRKQERGVLIARGP